MKGDRGRCKMLLSDGNPCAYEQGSHRLTEPGVLLDQRTMTFSTSKARQAVGRPAVCDVAAFTPGHIPGTARRCGPFR